MPLTNLLSPSADLPTLTFCCQPISLNPTRKPVFNVLIDGLPSFYFVLYSTFLYALGKLSFSIPYNSILLRFLLTCLTTCSVIQPLYFLIPTLHCSFSKPPLPV